MYKVERIPKEESGGEIRRVDVGVYRTFAPT